MVEELTRLFDKYVEKLQEFKKTNACKELVPVAELNAVISLTKLFDCFAIKKYGVCQILYIYNIVNGLW